MKSLRLEVVKTNFSRLLLLVNLIGLLYTAVLLVSCHRKPIYTELVGTVGQFPLRNGSNWRYVYKGSDTAVHDTIDTHIIGLPTNGTAQTALWIISHATHSDTLWCSQTDDSLTMYRREQAPNGGLICWLHIDYPLSIGKTWNFSQGNVHVLSKGTLQVGQQLFENVFELQVTPVISSLPITAYSVYFVQGIGIIKCSHDYLLYDSIFRVGDWNLFDYTIHS